MDHLTSDHRAWFCTAGVETDRCRIGSGGIRQPTWVCSVWIARYESGAAGRPVGADTLAWELSRPQPGLHGAGLTDDEERRLLAAFAAFAVAR